MLVATIHGNNILFTVPFLLQTFCVICDLRMDVILYLLRFENEVHTRPFAFLKNLLNFGSKIHYRKYMLIYYRICSK